MKQLKKNKKIIGLGLFLVFGMVFTLFLPTLLQKNAVLNNIANLNGLYYDSVTWTMPYGPNPVIIDGKLNSTGWGEWSDAEVHVICFNFSALYGDDSQNFAAYLYLKHNRTHKLIALDVN